MMEFVIPIVLQTVTSVAPAPPPPRKTGTFACEVRDRGGREFSLSGSMRDWQKVGDRETATIAIAAPERTGLSGDYQATFRYRQITLAKLGRVGLPIGTGMLLADFKPEGMIMLEHQAQDGSRGVSAYTGFCDVNFTTEG